jgi:uncharacterized protein (DUF2235 family)
LKLFRIVRKNDEQIVFYDPGVGTISSSDPWSRLKSNALGVLGLATGYGLDENVLDAYRFLVETYAEGDRIYLFGFSRGAYTIRMLAGFLRLVGLVAPSQAQDIKQVWFSGVHADIGGGYPETQSGPAKYPLGWLIDE